MLYPNPNLYSNNVISHPNLMIFIIINNVQNKINIPNCITIFYVDSSFETPSSLTNHTTFRVSASSTFTPSLSGSMLTRTPTVPKGKLNIRQYQKFIQYIHNKLYKHVM